MHLLGLHNTMNIQFLSKIIELGLFVFALILFIPIATLFVECMAAFLHTSRNRFGEKKTQVSRPPTAILVPAHNEALVIGNLLANLRSQITDPDRVIVIADNCTDETAEIAKSYKTRVIERKNPHALGKGFALDYGLRHLRSNPPQVVVMIDADCDVKEGSIDKLARLAISSEKPVQAVNLLELPENAGSRDLVSIFAFTVKNLVRPLGLKNLKQPCLLTGTGMAFAWSIIGEKSLASDNLVEDMQMSIDMAVEGYTTLLCTDARIVSQENVTKSQRTRWEHGHLKTIKTQIPKIVKAAIDQKRFDLIALGLDLSVPPLSLLVMLWLSVTAISFACSILGVGWLSTLVLSVEGLLIALSISTAYLKFASKIIPLRSFIAIPFYILWKIPVYFSFLLKPQTKWIRTDRNSKMSDWTTTNKRTRKGLVIK